MELNTPFCFHALEIAKLSGESDSRATHKEENVVAEIPDVEEEHSESDEEPVEEQITEEDFQKLTGRKKKLWELKQKMV